MAFQSSLTHHPSTHPPIRIGWHTLQTHCPPASALIDGIQNAHDFFTGDRWRYREKVIRVRAFLAETERKLLKRRSISPPERANGFNDQLAKQCAQLGFDQPLLIRWISRRAQACRSRYGDKLISLIKNRARNWRSRNDPGNSDSCNHL